MGRILVVGVGPGSEEHLTPEAKLAMGRAQAIAGGEQALRLAPGKEKKFVIGNNLSQLEGFIRENKARTVAVLASGDPGIFSILSFLLRKFDRKEIEVVPGISSLQLCFARLRDIWEDAKLVSLHGRERGSLAKEAGRCRKLAVFTDSRSPPQSVARELLPGLGKNSKAGVCSELGREKEKVFTGTLEEVAEREFPGNSIMVVWNEQGIRHRR